MWELVYKESRVPKSWCFWTVVLEKTLESPLDFQSILKEISPDYSLEGLMLKLKLQYFGHLMWRTAAAKSLQSCPTLCNPIDGSPPGSPVPGILQARTLEWVAISFSNAWKWKVKVKSLSRVRPLRPHGQQPTRLLCLWDSPGKSTGVGCHCLLQWRTDSLEKTLTLGKIEGRRRKGWQRMRWLDAITDGYESE